MTPVRSKVQSPSRTVMCPPRRRTFLERRQGRHDQFSIRRAWAVLRHDEREVI